MNPLVHSARDLPDPGRFAFLEARLRLKVRTNLDEVLGDLDRYVQTISAKAVPRALNKLADQARTAGLRAVNDEYQIGPRAFEKYVVAKLASTLDLEASLTVKGLGLPLHLFDPRQTKAGVSVRIKRRRVIIPHAFLARMKSGRVGVFARGAYGGKSGKLKPSGKRFGRFLFGRGRLPINELFTFGPAEAFGSEKVSEAMAKRIEEQQSKVLAQEIRAAAQGI